MILTTLDPLLQNTDWEPLLLSVNFNVKDHLKKCMNTYF